MPTSYTAPIYEGEPITFTDFAWRCARGMGALIHMRDEPLDAPIRETTDAEVDYHERQLAQALNDLVTAKALMTEEVERMAAAEHAEAIQRARTSHETTVDLLARYDAMIEQVEAWRPPTEDHVAFKDFMLGQLRESRKFDAHEYPAPEPQQTGAEYRAGLIAKAERNRDYHRAELAKARTRVETRREWIAALRLSLDGQVVAS